MKSALNDFIGDEHGQGTVEYVLVMAALVIASYMAIRLFAMVWRLKFDRIKLLRCSPLP
jgi:Flp pilus assembly pilin Flp